MITDDKLASQSGQHAESGSERLKILEQIERGEINAAEGLRRLEGLPSTPPGLPGPALAERAPDLSQENGDYASVLHPEPSPTPPEMNAWKRWWQIPLAVGIGIIIGGALLMASALQASGFGFWFVCATLPFVFGVVLAVGAWWSRTSRWLHIRVKTGQQTWPRNIAISLPVPIRLTAWALRNFGQYLPPLRGTSLDELILALDTSTSSATPFYVEVDKGEDGERVQVFIG